jgi:general secretion pathway protein K
LTTRQRPRSSRGFALAAALWLLAGLAIVVSLVNDAALTSAERVRQLRERADFMRSSLAARANLLYFLSLATPQAAGFQRNSALLLADETPYKFDALSVLRVQDLNGLVNLNSVERPNMERFLVSCGVLPGQVPYLIDALEDYIDEDNLQRVNGAEKDVYVLQGKPPPRNAPLLSVEEVYQVYGWAPYKQRWAGNGCAQALTTHKSTTGVINLATAPALVFKAVGVDTASAADLVSARTAGVEKTADRTNAANVLAGNTGMFGMGGGAVNGDLRITHEHATLPWVMGYTLKFDWTGSDKPWTFSQPAISPRLNSPALPASRALPWPKNSVSSAPNSDIKPALPF